MSSPKVLPREALDILNLSPVESSQRLPAHCKAKFMDCANYFADMSSFGSGTRPDGPAVAFLLAWDRPTRDQLLSPDERATFDRLIASAQDAYIRQTRQPQLGEVVFNMFQKLPQ